MNSILLAGRLVAAPVLRKTKENDVPFVGFTLAVDKPLNSEQKAQARANGRETVHYFECIAWRSNAEYLSRYHKKGDTVVLKGVLEHRNVVAELQVQGEAKGNTAAVNIRNYSVTVESVEGAGAQLSDLRSAPAEASEPATTPTRRGSVTPPTRTEPARATSRQAVLDLVDEDEFDD